MVVGLVLTLRCVSWGTPSETTPGGVALIVTRRSPEPSKMTR